MSLFANLYVPEFYLFFEYWSIKLFVGYISFYTVVV